MVPVGVKFVPAALVTDFTPNIQPWRREGRTWCWPSSWDMEKWVRNQFEDKPVVYIVVLTETEKGLELPRQPVLR